MICAEANEGGDIVVPCKHCDETTIGVDCEACGEIVPSATAHLCVEDSTWLCPECNAELSKDLEENENERIDR